MRLDFTQLKTLEEVSEDVLFQTSLHNDRQVSLSQFVQAMTSPETVVDGGEELVITPQGFRSLAGMINIPSNQAGLLQNAALSDRTKLAVIRDMASVTPDKGLFCRVNGDHIDGFVSDEYTFFDHRSIILALLHMQSQNLIPDTARVMSYHLGQDSRQFNLRLISPDDWSFVVGRGDEFNGNLIIQNNELGSGSFRAKCAITRNECTNTTIGQNVFNVNHRYATFEKFMKALHDAVGQVGEWAHQMGQGMEQMQTIQVESPVLLFEQIGEKLGVPQYAMTGDTGAVRYWEDQGEGHTLFDVVQAVTAGTQAITDRRTPRWDRRDMFEEKIWAVAESLISMHENGEPVEDWYLTGDVGIRERAARYVEGFTNKIDEAPLIAEGIRSLEV